MLILTLVQAPHKRGVYKQIAIYNKTILIIISLLYIQLPCIYDQLQIFLRGLLCVSHIFDLMDPLRDSCYDWPRSRIIIQTLLHWWPHTSALSYHLIKVAIAILLTLLSLLRLISLHGIRDLSITVHV